MSATPFSGQTTELSREEAVEQYVLLRLRTEDINRLDSLVRGLYDKSIRIPHGSPYTNADLKDTARTAFFGWFATLKDKDERAVYAFDPLYALFPNHQVAIYPIQLLCESCHRPLQRFRNNVAFHSRSSVSAQIDARRDLTTDDTFIELEEARTGFQKLMATMIAVELIAIPELREVLDKHRLTHHPAFRNIFPSSSTNP